MRRVLGVGECMVELREIGPDTLRVGYSGDTYNTVVYLARVAGELGVELDIGYLTGVGADAYSQSMRDAWADEGIHDRALLVADRTPGIYAIRTTGDGERSFTYWRDRSAASALLAAEEWIEDVDGDVIHLSGVTLQLTSTASRERLLDRLRGLREAGAWISLDVNYRPAGWPSADVAAAAIDRFSAVSSVVFSSGDDERTLRGACDPRRELERIAAAGPGEVILRDGAAGAYVLAGGEIEHVPAVAVRRVVDTTAAGDAFTGGYLAARLARQTATEAARVANRVASTVIQHPGAIVAPGVPLAGRAPPRPTTPHDRTR
jgi:2-dehydro-3-deoxygluconokinase